MSLNNLVSAFVEAATWHGALTEAEAMLSAHPEIRTSGIHAAAVLGDDAAVRNFLAADPESATKKANPYDTDALVYLCLSKYLRLKPELTPAFLRIATALLDAGADPNAGFLNHGEFETCLYGAAGVAHHAELTRLLLARGGDPNDMETFYHAPETYDNGAVKVLVESGKMHPEKIAGMLLRKADWHDYEGIKYLLEHGADPNLMTLWGYTALHQALRRDNNLKNIEVMLDHGADPEIRTRPVTRPVALPSERRERDAGWSAAVIAARRGRGDVLATISNRRMAMKFMGVEKLIAACATNDAVAARSIIAAEPQLLQDLLKEGHNLLAEFSGTNNPDGVRLLLDFGVPVTALYGGDAYFDIARDSTALHVAAWKAWPAVVKLLIERGAPVNAVDGNGRTSLMLAVRACVDSYWKWRRTPESVEALLNAGAVTDGIEIPCGYDEVDRLLQSKSR